MGLNFNGKGPSMGGKITVEIPTPTYSGTADDNAATSINPYTTLGPGPGGAGETWEEIDEIRNPPLGDKYWANVSFLMSANSQTAGTLAVDSGPLGKTIVPLGGSTIEAVQAKFGTTSLYSHPGVARVAQVAIDADLTFGVSEDYTIEYWFYLDAGFVAFSMGNYSGEGGSIVGYDNGSALSAQQLKAGSPSNTWWTTAGGGGLAGAWHHHAISRNSDTINSYFDGVLAGSAVSSVVSPSGVSTKMVLGGMDTNDTLTNPYRVMQGSLDQVRITKGVGRYPAAFAVPTEAFPQFG